MHIHSIFKTFDCSFNDKFEIIKVYNTQRVVTDMSSIELYLYLQLYYRQKGSRPVTRPQALQETFDSCADVIVQKLQSYYQQADEYHNQCLQGASSTTNLLIYCV